MSIVITERELDKMEVESEVVVGNMERDFDKSFAGKRHLEIAEEDQEPEVQDGAY